MGIDGWQGVISLVIDGVMVIAMVGLWLLWLQGSRRQHAVELKLEAASAQLKEASAQLNALMPLLAEMTDPRPSPAPASREVVAPQSVETQPKPKATKAKERSAVDDDGDARLARLLCLSREGATAEQIARQLDMPLAQVKLLLQVNSSSRVKTPL
ncbi:MAG: hypothetical protein Q9M13_02095 [Mariprofundales bacterium]|nr:hypothetical protein [Mariprofundales bacterium]